MSRPDDFIEISGSKMRKLAAQGAKPCDVSDGKEIPSDLLAANCIPPGFMVQSGWEIVCDYYQHVESPDWVPYSVMNPDPLIASGVSHEGKYGAKTFKLYLTQSGGSLKSAWHDVPLYASGSSGLVNFIVEIPMYRSVISSYRNLFIS